MIRLEPRPEPSRLMSAASPVLALAITVVVAVALFVMLGKDPMRGLQVFFVEPLASARALSELALKATPLILCAVGLAFCFRSNVWNIGAEGQFLMGAVAGGGVALLATVYGWGLPKIVGVPLVLLGGVVGGMAWAAVVAVLRDRFNANEILVSLMLVYVANLFLSYLVFGPWKDPKGFNFPQTVNFADETLMPRLVTGFRAHVGFVISLVVVALAWLVMQRTLLGYQLQVGGLAPAAARYAGFSSRKALWVSLLVSGACAGMAGAMEAAGPVGQLTPYLSTGYGFTAIIVAFVGRLHPVGCVFSGLLLSMFLIGGELAQSRLGLPAALTGVFQGMLLVSLLACDTLIAYRIRWGRALKGAA
jgi:general nucleoside transport system permease protein